MIRRITRIPARDVTAHNHRFRNRRNFSLISVHSSFPATLYRFQLQPESKLYDKNFQPEDTEIDDAVEISRDGLVCPGISDTELSNGAVFMPNTRFMQELTRLSYDNYLDSVRDGHPSGDPHYLSIPKGTPIPSELVLFRERNAQFSLQPSHPMLLSDLNRRLTEFYSKFGTLTAAGEWLQKNTYQEAFDETREDWMRE
ncbi:hypothetical protein M432DRAFT_603817 [Thermoascus aurantiacus ATCC 26904]